MTVLKGELAVNQSKALIRTFKAMKDYIIENQGLINQRDYLQLSLVVAEHSRDINVIKSSLSTIDNEVAEVIDRLGNVVTKSELSGFMNIFGEPEFRNEYVLWDGQPFESDLAYSTIYGKAEKTLYVIDNYIGMKTLALLKNSKDKKTRYYYYCKNTVNATGHKCTFRMNIEQTELNRMVAAIISAMVNKPIFVNAFKEKIGTKNRLEKQMDNQRIM